MVSLSIRSSDIVNAKEHVRSVRPAVTCVSYMYVTLSVTATCVISPTVKIGHHRFFSAEFGFCFSLSLMDMVNLRYKFTEEN